MLSYRDIEIAAGRLEGIIVKTPILESPDLNAIAGCRLLVKAEALQRTGAFKIRGAFNKLISLGPDARKKGVLASSSGNHGNALAFAAKTFGISAKIVMPSDAPALKVSNTLRNGAEVVFYDRARDDRFEIVSAMSRESGMIDIPPYDDAEVMSGQGTIGIEVADYLEAIGSVPDAVLIPSSGGGLSSGITVAIKSRFPTVDCYTVEPIGMDRMARSLLSGCRETNARGLQSIQDALIGAPMPGKLPFEVLLAYGAKGISVTDTEVTAAMAKAFKFLKVVMEPGGAAAVAAVLSRREEFSGKTVIAICSGGNVDPQMFSRAIGTF